MTDATKKYTEAQEQAITHRGAHILVSAAAGSGKTMVLVDRIVSMICHDKVPLSQMLVVTFTNAAAGEMKDRLAVALEAEMTAEEHQQAFIKEQLDALPQAHVSTMHAFCSRELRRYYHYLDLDPNFRILVGQQADTLQNQALDAVLEERYESEDAAFLALVEAYGARFKDEPIRHMVYQLDRMANASEDPLSWLDAIIEAPDDAISIHLEALFKELAGRCLDDMAAALDRMADIIDENDGLAPYGDTLAADTLLYEQLKKSLSDSIVVLIDQLPKMAMSRLKALRKENKEAVADEAALFKKCREDGVKKALKDMQEWVPYGGWAQIKSDRLLTTPYLNTLVCLTKDFRERYQALKKEKSALDFSDLEHGMLRLLSIPDAQMALRNEIQWIFFDEYQDANPIQEAIINKLQGEDNMFFVGDVKQAIYRFRQSDPALFNRRYGRYGQPDNDDEVLIHLSENFRSRKEILDFSNAVFSMLMTERMGDIDYCSDGQALKSGRQDVPFDQAVTVALIDHNSTSMTRLEAEARWIAQEVKRLVEEEGKRYGDMAVLFRVPSTALRHFQSVFMAENIPFYSDNSLVSFSNMEVQLFIDWLRVIDNDEQDGPLIALLLSPFGQLTDEELAVIRIKHPQGRFFEAAKAYLTMVPEDAIGWKLRYFYDQIAQARDALRRKTLSVFLEDIFNESGYADYLLALNRGSERYGNVCAFLDLARTYEKSEPGSLYSFLRHVDQLRARANDNLQPAIALGDDANYVRLMSIHKSKGLGFDTVFLADMNHQFNMRDAAEKLQLHPELGAALDVVQVDKKTRRKSFAQRLMIEKSRQETKSEEVRLLYVAMTRAKERLYLIISDQHIQELYEKDVHAPLTLALQKARSFAQWFCALLSQDAIVAAFNCHFSESTQLDKEAENALFDLNVFFEDNPPNEKSMKAIEETLSFQYPYASDTVTPYKKTVTMIAKGEAVMNDGLKYETLSDTEQDQPSISMPSREIILNPPDFLDAHHHFTAVERGTILHRAMELIPLEKVSRTHIQSTLADWIETGIFTEAEAQAVSIEGMMRFFESALGEEVLANRENVVREAPFTMRYRGHIVDGRIDLYYERADGLVIIDFKTDRVADPEKHKRQMDLYAGALEAAKRKPVTGMYIFWLQHGFSSRLR